MLLSPKHLPRLAAIVELFTRYGLRDVARQQGLLETNAASTDNDPPEGDDHNELAAGFRARLVELGPAYVKLGQALSTRPDLLPPAYIRELESLQDDVGPIPFADVEATVESELGARLTRLFEFFDPEPLGTASLGQVHGARLRDGRAVVVKIQRPHVRETLAADVAFFRELAEFLAAHTQAGTRLDVVGVIQQLERTLADELDYRLEARSAAVLRRSLAEFPRIVIPKVIEAYSSERVITMERVRGVKVDAIPPIARIDYDFAPLAEELTRAYLKGITIDGFFHADPHPGNVFVVMPDTHNPRTPAEMVSAERRDAARPAATPLAQLEVDAQAAALPVPDDVSVRLALVDFGMTARLSTKMRERVTRLLMALGDDRDDDVASSLIEMCDPAPEFDRAGYTREISDLVTRTVELSSIDVAAGRLMFSIIDVSYRHGLRLPAELTLLAKALFNLDAVTRALHPSFVPLEAIRSYGNELALARAKREMSPRHLYRLALESGDLMSALPHRLDQITARLANNELSANVNVPQVSALIVVLQKVANRIFSGLVLAGLLIASAMLLPYWRVLGLVGFVIAAVLALYMVLMIIASDRSERSRR
jgi:predicted unusual protein kinase regulating ubiquinone biosynthesis (AarF/ABC1/UbiB family)